MRTRIGSVNLFAALALLLLALPLLSCGEGKSGTSGISSPAGRGTVEGGAIPDTNNGGATLGEITEEIEAYPAPDDLDEGVYEMLREEFLKVLGENPGRLTATVPPGEAGLVTDLSYDLATGFLSWSYVNRGDYNLSGDVSIADVAEVARYYLADATDGEGDDPYEAWVDGSGDGEVNIADVAPIALNYLNEVRSYLILTGGDEAGSFIEVGRVEFKDFAGAFPVKLQIAVPEGAAKYIRVQPIDSQGSFGAMTPPVDVSEIPVPPAIDSVEPTGGNEDSEVVFEAFVSGTQPFTYAWDFGGGATPNTSFQPSLTVTLASDGEYEASLRVTSAFGEDTYPFTLLVNDTPSANVVAEPAAGNPPLSVTFDASGSTDSDGSVVGYEWDFEGDGVYEFDSGSVPTAEHIYVEAGNYDPVLRVTDAGGATDEAAVSITILELPDISGTLSIATPPNRYAYLSGAPGSVFGQSRETHIEGSVTSASFSGSCWLEIGLVTQYTYDQSINVYGVPAYMFNQNVFAIIGKDGGGLYVQPSDYNGFGGQREPVGASFTFDLKLEPNVGLTGGTAYLSVDGGAYGPGMVYGMDNWEYELGWDLPEENFDGSVLVAQMYGYDGGTGDVTFSALVTMP